MGRTPKPLRIIVRLPLQDWSEIQALKEQGHEVVLQLDDPYRSEWVADLILGPTCWFMDDAHRKYLDLAIKSARARRYPKEEK